MGLSSGELFTSKTFPSDVHTTACPPLARTDFVYSVPDAAVFLATPAASYAQFVGSHFSRTIALNFFYDSAIDFDFEDFRFHVLEFALSFDSLPCGENRMQGKCERKLAASYAAEFRGGG